MVNCCRPSLRTLADLLERLGRVRSTASAFVRHLARPPRGCAGNRRPRKSSLRIGRWVLVEKPVGYGQSILAVFLGRMLGNFVAPRNLGHVTGEQGMVRLFPGLVRIPMSRSPLGIAFPTPLDR